MKQILTLTLLLFASPLIAQFEGKIETTTIGEFGSIDQTWFVSKDAIKITFVNPTGTGDVNVELIAKKGSSELIIITKNGENPGYFVAPISTIKSQYDFSSMNFTKGSSSDKGQKFQGANKQLQCAVWMNDLEVDLSPYSVFFKDEPAFYLAGSFNQKGLSNSTLITNHNGELIYSSKVNNVAPSKLEASVFEIPEGLKETLIEAPKASK